MYPSVYLFSKKEEWFCLYLDQFSTLEALCLLPSTLEIKITCFGASCYKNYGWATEKDIPALYTIQDLRDFFQNNESIGLIEFETKLENLGYLNTHNDGECHFRLKKRNDLINILRLVTPNEVQEVMISELLANPGIYIRIDNSFQLKKYSSFKDYLKDEEN